jgi:hypothetical protein
MWIFSRCPLFPQKRTLLSANTMSVLCQKRTHALQQYAARIFINRFVQLMRCRNLRCTRQTTRKRARCYPIPADVSGRWGPRSKSFIRSTIQPISAGRD